MPVIPLATRSQHVDFAYDQVVRPHRIYRPSGGLPRGKPRTRHMWICLQLSGDRGVDNAYIIDVVYRYMRLLFWHVWKHLLLIWPLKCKPDLPGIMSFPLLHNLPRLVSRERRTNKQTDRQTLRKFIFR